MIAKMNLTQASKILEPILFKKDGAVDIDLLHVLCYISTPNFAREFTGDMNEMILDLRKQGRSNKDIIFNLMYQLAD